MTSFDLKKHLHATVLTLLALLVLHLVVILYNDLSGFTWRALTIFTWELPTIVLAVFALGTSRIGFAFRVILVAMLTFITALKGADMAMFASLTRSFNLVSDLPLIVSLYQLVVGALGHVAALLAVIAAVLSIVGVAAALWWACRHIALLPKPQVLRPGFAPAVACVGAIFFSGIVITKVGDAMDAWETPVDVPGIAFTARIGVERTLETYNTLADLRAFRTASRDDPFARQGGLFDIVDRDVFVVFIESYGRASFDTPLYTDLHLETLKEAHGQLEAAGLSMASTFLTSPTQGGQSWLAHSSFANGLWIDNQTSYRAALTSGRQTLFHLAAKAGFHTAAVMPQITLDWPEAQTMGFDTILAAEDLGYQGQPFNWITMPDQFTYAAADRYLRNPRLGDKRLFVQVATGSSHAPWVPVPELIDWDDLGDGTIFDPVVAQSETPRTIWRDRDRVRAQYRLAVDYALQAVFAYAELHAENPPLMLIIGDHQPAGFVALDERPDVPMHIVGPAHLVDLLADEGFTPGLIPDARTIPRPMSDLRAHVLQSLSSTQVADVVVEVVP
ncbi:MAG: sulfatase-like hydrolase/transferase [Pseudomonadota bacterium]